MGKEKYFGSLTVLRGRTLSMNYRGEFYVDLNVLESNVSTSSVHGVEMVFDSIRLGEIFHIPSVGLSEYGHRKVLKGEMFVFHKFLFELAHKGIFPRGQRRHKASFWDIGIAHALENKDPIDWPILMIKHIARVVYPNPGSHQLAFGNILTIVFKAFNVPLGEGRVFSRYDMITISTLVDCHLAAESDQVDVAPSRAQNDAHVV
ncbi:hypothetical protein R3W88_016573 [Solanum pinnatisectum]|uniref:Uncharacterized protein n=1 Tax=Solanum pinnatisectum TaxID=50273 RepID=A0AAV9L0U1_9SOLN|nr:hypothetical protein R3W88_016573 [Solanum pinnatisectum]